MVGGCDTLDDETIDLFASKTNFDARTPNRCIVQTGRDHVVEKPVEVSQRHIDSDAGNGEFGSRVFDRLKPLLRQDRGCQERELLVRASVSHTAVLSVDSDTSHPVSYTHLRAHETGRNLVCRLLLEKKKTKKNNKNT